MLVMAAKGDLEIEARRKALPRIGQLPFDSVRKMMTSVNIVDGKPVAFTKGAPKETLSFCTHILMGNEIVPFTEQLKEEVLAENDSQAREGRRGVTVAYRPLDFSDGFTGAHT